MVAHVLHSPIRVTVLPMEHVNTHGVALPGVLLLQFAVHRGQDVRDQLKFQLLYGYLDECITGRYNTENVRIHFFRVEFTVCEWDSLMVIIDETTGIACNILSQHEHTTQKVATMNASLQTRSQC